MLSNMLFQTENLITGSEDYIPKRAGHLNEETQYVLEKCGVKPPAYIKDVRPQVRDIDVRKISGISEDLSVRNAWKLMKERGVETLPIIEDDKLKGLVTISDVAKSYLKCMTVIYYLFQAQVSVISWIPLRAKL